jgi:hypothetical protein
MKLSLKLLIALALTLIVGMFGAAISVRHQYDSFDKSDPYARWQRRAVPSFRAVLLTGPSSTVVQIEPGNTTRILADTANGWREMNYTQRVEHDTLFLTIKPKKGWELRPDDDDDNDQWVNAQVVVQTPKFLVLVNRDANCRVSDFQGNVLTLTQDGKAGRITLEHLDYRQLNASLSGNNLLTIRPEQNRFDRGNITVRDSARLYQYRDFTSGFRLQADSTATLRLTGKAVRQMREK